MRESRSDAKLGYSINLALSLSRQIAIQRPWTSSDASSASPRRSGTPPTAPFPTRTCGSSTRSGMSGERETNAENYKSAFSQPFDLHFEHKRDQGERGAAAERRHTTVCAGVQGEALRTDPAIQEQQQEGAPTAATAKGGKERLLGLESVVSYLNYTLSSTRWRLSTQQTACLSLWPDGQLHDNCACSICLEYN